jgi:hypothetical protein
MQLMGAKMSNNKLMIRNSTAEFLIFTQQNEDNGIEVLFQDETIWLTQKMMAELFNVKVPAISKHLNNIFQEFELERDTTISILETVQKEGLRNVRRKVEYYNLDAIIAVGYRVNSKRATQFRKWATQVLKTFAIKGYVLDKERMKNGSFLGYKFFDDLLEEIREIRLSERMFYQKITDIYATAMDYDSKAESTRIFFAKVQNKMHFAIHHHTAAELIMERADSKKEFIGLTNWKKFPEGKILKSDVSVAKNYLSKEEIKSLERIVTMYLDYAEDRAKRHIPMTMEDWSQKLDAFLKFNERDVLADSGKISAELAKQFAENEFEKYRTIQDKTYKSDFDKDLVKQLEIINQSIGKSNE